MPTPKSLDRRRWMTGAAGVAAVALTAGLPGCAAFNQISVEVTTFGAWPDKRPAGRYAFDRLPSQAQAPEQASLEAAAAQALQRAGFTPAASPDQASVLVQLGWSRSRVISPWGDPWWGMRGFRRFPPPPDRRAHGSVGIGVGFGAGFGPGWPEADSFDRQVVQMLLIDRASRDKLVEIQVRHEARYSSVDFLPLFFEAGLHGFPALVAGTRQITVQIPPAP